MRLSILLTAVMATTLMAESKKAEKVKVQAYTKQETQELVDADLKKFAKKKHGAVIEIKEDVETKEQEKIKPKAEETKEKSIENLKEEDHRKIEAKVKEIREKLQQEGKSQKEKVPSAFELAEKKESKKPKKNNKK